jgi:hypothetical protein
MIFFFFFPSFQVKVFSEQFHLLSECCPYTLKLDEEKSQHVGLAQQHSFGPSIFKQFAESGKQFAESGKRHTESSINMISLTTTTPCS